MELSMKNSWRPRSSPWLGATSTGSSPIWLMRCFTASMNIESISHWT